jgi:hypothetical protein
MRSMKTRLMLFVLVPLAAHTASAQRPGSRKPTSVAAVAARIADSTATAMAAAEIDRMLGTAKALGIACPAATVPVMAMPGLAGVPPISGSSPGSALVGLAKSALAKAKKSTDPATVTPEVTCVSVATLQAMQGDALAAMQAGLANQSAVGSTPVAPTTGSIAKTIAGATPAGALLSGAALAAPMAGKAAKALGGLLGKGAPSKEGMIKDLAKGRLALKHVKFLPASDALEDGFEESFAMLAEALVAMEGKFVLNVPVETVDQGEPQVAIAKRRIAKIEAGLLAAGISKDRLVVGSYPPGLDPKKKSPKPGEGQLEVILMPPGFVP